MENVVVNAESKLIQMASCLGRFSKSWDGFYSLRIFNDTEDLEANENLFLPAKSIVESYLGGIEGRAYYAEKGLHILCKYQQNSILEEAGMQICELLTAESGKNFRYHVYDLSLHAEEYARIAEIDCDGALYFSSTNKYLDREVNEFLPRFLEEQNNKYDLAKLTKVLLIEDDPVTRWMVRSSLKNECEFACAPTAHKAFSMYSSFNPDIVFLDINLPDDTGYSVLQWIMNNDPGAFVVMFSSHNSLTNITEALEKGAMGFIAKPFLRDNLLQYIVRTVN